MFFLQAVKTNCFHRTNFWK